MFRHLTTHELVIAGVIGLVALCAFGFVLRVMNLLSGRSLPWNSTDVDAKHYRAFESQRDFEHSEFKRSGRQD